MPGGPCFSHVAAPSPPAAREVRCEPAGPSAGGGACVSGPWSGLSWVNTSPGSSLGRVPSWLPRAGINKFGNAFASFQLIPVANSITFSFMDRFH